MFYTKSPYAEFWINASVQKWSSRWCWTMGKFSSSLRDKSDQTCYFSWQVHVRKSKTARSVVSSCSISLNQYTSSNVRTNHSILVRQKQYQHPSTMFVMLFKSLCSLVQEAGSFDQTRIIAWWLYTKVYRFATASLVVVCWLLWKVYIYQSASLENKQEVFLFHAL